MHKKQAVHTFKNCRDRRPRRSVYKRLPPGGSWRSMFACKLDVERSETACRLRESARQRNYRYFKASAPSLVSQAPPPARAGAPSRREPRVTLRRINGTPVPTVQNSLVSRFVSTFKRFCNKEYGENIWQYRSNDHIIRNRKDYEEHCKYIIENPLYWQYDKLYGDK